MAKNESTAINSLIQIAQGRIVEGPGPDLFSTRRPNLFAVPQQMQPVQPVAPRRIAAGTPSPYRGPLPSSQIARPQAAQAPVVRAHYKAETHVNPVARHAAVAQMTSFEDDDAMTCRVDPALREEVLRQANEEMARKAASTRAARVDAELAAAARAISDLETSGEYVAYPPQYAVPSYVQAPTVHAQPVSPQPYAQPRYAQPTYAPQYAAHKAPNPAMHAGAYRAYGSAPRSPRPVTYLTFGQEIRLLLTRYTLQAGAVVIVLAISVSYLLFQRSHAHAAPAPAVAASLMPQPVMSVNIAAPAMPAPIVEPIAEPAPSVTPIVEAAPSAAPAPEVVAVAAVEPVTAVEPVAVDIEMAPIVAKKPHHGHHEKRVAARTAPAPRAKPAKVEAPARESVVKLQRSKKEIASDPVLAELSKPAKGGKVDPTGPGKVSITSSEPATIYIDGRASQMHTPQTISLPPGAHRITLLSVATNKAKTSDIDVTAGKTIAISRQF